MTVSFILAVYNIAPYIAECLHSVLPCLRDGDELIVVNDGSTDGSRQLVGELIGHLPQARIVDKANGGLSSARNAGLRIATREYVLFLDGDDALIPEAVAQARQALDEHGPDVLVTDYFEWLDDGRGERRASRPRSHLTGQVSSTPARHLKETLNDCIPCVWTRFFRRPLLEALGEAPFPEWCMYDDLPTTPHLVARASTMLYMPLPMVLYRARAGSLTQLRTERSCIDMVRAAIQAYKATELFPSDASVLRSGLAFLARKWVDAIKQGRQTPRPGWTLYSKMLSLISPTLLSVDSSQLADLWQSTRTDDRKVRRHLKLARRSRLLYVLIQTLIGWRKRLRARQRM